ncbi:hypothetical protein HK096_000646, partial [Nowakowskiella sp. JEL0078]
MTSLFRHSENAEDQSYSRSILTTHVVLRSFTAGAVLSLVPYTFVTIRNMSKGHSLSITKLLPFSAYGVIAGGVLGVVMVQGRMWGREQIEWQDRSWRLQENKDQASVDVWTLGSMGLASVVQAVVDGKLVPVKIAGAAGLGTIAGTLGYVLFRSYKVKKE